MSICQQVSRYRVSLIDTSSAWSPDFSKPSPAVKCRSQPQIGERSYLISEQISIASLQFHVVHSLYPRHGSRAVVQGADMAYIVLLNFVSDINCLLTRKQIRKSRCIRSRTSMASGPDISSKSSLTVCSAGCLWHHWWCSLWFRHQLYERMDWCRCVS